MIRVASLYDDLAASMARLRENHAAVDASRETVRAAMRGGGAHYGINTGFGSTKDRREHMQNMCDQVGAELRKGDQFGYFLFGGSDIVMLFQDRNLVIDAEVGTHYRQGRKIAHIE